ncbi:MAG: hypothetical protein J7647_30940 [Cyanobacteria bacterium SBLK]|nr:hypothetical protein [Cyanobacteria bacterium SBLK]
MMLTTYQLNTLACRAVWGMRSNAANYWFFHPKICIQRPQLKPYNDFFEVYWSRVHLGNMVLPGCGQDWQLHLVNGVTEKSLIFRFFSEAISLIIPLLGSIH